MFKVGDKVVCLEDVGLLKEGEVYTVREPYPGDTLEGRDDGFIYLAGDMRSLGGYYPSRFEIYEEPKLTEAQAAGVAGGLQQHSVGDVYPWAVVMYEHKGNRLIAIENLQTGVVSAIGGRPINWGTFDEAYKRLEGKPLANVIKGRVMYADGEWVVAKEVNPVRVTRLHSMLHRGENTNSSGS